MPTEIGSADLHIFDNTGRMVLTKNIAGNSLEKIELNELMNGYYSYQIHEMENP